MNDQRWRRVEELYHAALEREPAGRPAFLAAACTGDGELRREVESLLDFDARPDSVLEEPAWRHFGSGGAKVVSAPAFPAGHQLGVYRIIELLGSGGMGDVYRALDTRLGRDVALKVLAPEMNTNPEWRQRFIREAQAASRLNHPSIVTIYDVGETDGVPFIAMEYIAGCTLAQLLASGGLPAATAARYAVQIAGALATAHAAGVIHRDVKPSNIMIAANGILKILDFGLARLDPTGLDSTPGRDSDSVTSAISTRAGVILGSAAYMSPEQAAGRPVDARSDIFAWGVLLYEMLSGRRPFHEDSRFATMAAILHKEPAPLSPETPPELADIVRRCMQKEPVDRFQSIAEAASALAAFDGAASFEHPAVGQTISNYRLLAELREESSGIVYKAEDLRLARFVALKVLATRNAVREARTASSLDHSNIGTVYEAGETPDGRVFIATAFYPGGSVKEKIEAGVSLREAVDFVRQTALGLANAHQQGIVHGGIRPGCLMLTSEGILKITDFGLGPGRSAAPYASPEVARGEALHARSDIWSIGAVLRELIPSEAPPALAAIVHRAMQIDPALRYSSADEMARDLAVFERDLAPDARLSRRARWIAAAALVAAIAGGSWFVLRQRNIRWVHQSAMPEIARLADRETNLAAMNLARRALAILPADPALEDLWKRVSANISIDTDPPGATVEVKDYLTPSSPWTVLGQTPVHKVPFPWGYSRVRISKPGTETYEFAHQLQGAVSPDLRIKLDPAGTWPAAMVKVPVRSMLSEVAGVAVRPVTSEFYFDRTEVTNRDFQKFVDAGGYRDRRFWKEPFIKDGHPLPWEQAMAAFVDATGQPGPSTWEAGRFPAGRENLPVSGVSWYEAAAYAEFAGKSLPTVSHWYAAAWPGIAPALIRLSNLNNIGPGPAAPGSFQGISAGGAFDMGGNVKEWCLNASGAKRYILGGSWRDPAYQFSMPDAQDPFDRSADNGFRCARYLRPPDPGLLTPMEQIARDYTKEKPVSDDVFRGFQALYEYEHRDPEGRIEAVDESSPDWIRQRVSYDAGHGKERMPAVLFLPRNAKPPYETVVYFPGSGAFLYPDSQRDLVAFYQLDYVVRSGRAVLYPVYEGTYERRDRGQLSRMQFRNREIDWSREVERSFDYLETRKDVDRANMAFLGFSAGSRAAVRLAAYPRRVKTVLILSAGLPPLRYEPEVDLVNFASRLKAPVLLLNGRYDFTFPVDQYQRPLFQLLGAPEKDKKFVLLEYAHNVGALPNEMRREVLAWLDRYLRPVK